MARTSKAAGKAAGKRPVGGELERVSKATVDLIEKFGPLQIPHLFGITAVIRATPIPRGGGWWMPARIGAGTMWSPSASAGRSDLPKGGRDAG